MSFKHKILKQISSIALACGAIIPASSLVVSCHKEITADIQSISLSLKPNYICPGQTVSIRKKIYPYAATDNPLNWEILDCPYDGFRISQNGEITAPRDITITDPQMMHIKASDANDPTIFDELAIAIINKPEPDQKFIGFANNEITYKDVNGQKASVKIVKTDTGNSYKTEKPIDLFIGRPFENIEFLPIVGKSRNNKMKFHLHGDDKTLRTLSWIGYVDNTWVEEIPTFAVTYVQHMHDVIDVKFACDDSVTLQINFNAYQSPGQYTPAEMLYRKENYHEISQTGEEIYNSQIKLPINHSPTQIWHQDIMQNIYVFRKPYEYLDELVFSIEYPTSGITNEMIKCDITSELKTWREYDNYKAYKVTLNFSIDLSKFDAKTWDYEAVNAVIFRVTDPIHGHGCYCNFYALWDNIEEGL